MRFRSQHTRDTQDRVGAPIEGESRTKQSFRDECDINFLIDRYKRTGVEPRHVNRRSPIFADVSMVGDYHDALQNVAAVEELFQELPAKVRARFQNNPVELLDFVQNATRDELLEVGLLDPEADGMTPEPAPDETAPAE